jgi:hypothetical protein
MKRIDIHNYELFAIDYIENTLDIETKQEFEDFLEQHLDIKQEIENLFDIEIKPQKIYFKDKVNLKKSPIEGLSYFEYLCISDIEGTVSFDEKKELKTFLNDKDKLAEYKLFLKTKLKSKSEEFPEKGKLKKHNISTFSRISFAITSLAAMLILFVGIKFNSQKQTQIIAPCNSIANFKTRQIIDNQTDNNDYEIKKIHQYQQNDTEIIIAKNNNTDSNIFADEENISDILAEISPKEEKIFLLSDTTINLKFDTELHQNKYFVKNIHYQKTKGLYEKIDAVKIVNIALQGFDAITESDYNMKVEVNDDCYAFEIKNKTYNLCLK